jgi:phosphoribosyl 1,2-cyclic phosphodiesterase
MLAAVRITILASGSGGNATLVEAGGTRLLVDTGVGPDTVRERMRSARGEVLAIDAIVTTHAHGDHVGKLHECARAFGSRVYMTEGTQRRVRAPGGVPTILFGHAVPFDVGAIRIEPMAIPHDAPQVALVFAHASSRAALVTDLGEVPRRLAQHLAGCQLVLLESNHDPELLRRGPYPEFLKRRIASRLGHLSNEQASGLLRELGPDTVEVVLMHLSQRNNSPLLALGAARAALHGRPVTVRVAHQDATLDLAVRASAVTRTRAPVAQLALPL